MKKGIDHKIHDSFESFNAESAPGFVWNKIEDQINGHDLIDKKVNSSFSEINDQAPEYIWNNVQDQLDINNVWRRITSLLPVDKWSLPYAKIASLALLLLLPFYAINPILENYSTSEIIASAKESNSSKDGDHEGNGMNNNFPDQNIIIVGQETSLSLINAGQKDDTDVLSHDNSLLSQIPSNLSSESETNYQLYTSSININEKYGGNNVTITTERIDSIAKIKLTPSLISLEDSKMEIARTERDEDTKNESEERRKLSYGLVANYNNTWLLNYETKQGFEDNSLVENKLSFGNSYGLYLNYNLNQKYSVQAQYFFNKTSRQINNIYLQGEYTRKETKFESMTSAVLIRRNFNLKHKVRPQQYSIGFGAFTDFLKNNTITLNGNVTNKKNTYKHLDFGIKNGNRKKHSI